MTDTTAPSFTDRPASFTDGEPRRRRSGWRLVRGAWRLLVGIKDALVLVLLLLFFGLLFAGLTARPGTKAIGEGALLLDLNGSIVEQPEEPAAFAALSGQETARQFRLRDVLRALDAARTDARVKAVVLDLDRFGGAYPAALQEIGDAVRRVRQGGKPVLAYADSYTDGAYRLAANASEIWMNPFGQVLFAGPGGPQLFYKGLLDRLGVNVHVYRVGRYKSFVEPFTRADQSPDARAASQALYSVLLDQWRSGVATARPKAQIAGYLTDPVGRLAAGGNDITRANVADGLVDRLGGRLAFQKRVAAIVGAQPGKPAGTFRSIDYAAFVEASKPATTGDAIGVVTVAGDIVDGDAAAGTAGGDTIAKVILKALAERKLKALVVRIDSPGGSAFASERIRQALLQAKAQGLPVVASMGGMAASGGYWVATGADAILAEPSTVTGSIGIFGLLPTFEASLAKIGITSDGVRTTPLTGQPDLIGGTTPELDRLVQAGIERGYRDFLGRVAKARRMTPARVDEIGQGRVWDGGTARQLGLVDRFGGLPDAVAEAARRARLDPAKVHAVYLEKEPGWAATIARSLSEQEDESGAPAGGDAFTRIAAGRRAVAAQALGDFRRLATAGAIQARCLECGGLGPSLTAGSDARLLDLLLARLGLGG